MNRIRRNRHHVEHDNVHRWLVSYADYMTLLFALFVVLYAMAIVNEEEFETITESIGKVFQADKPETKNRGQGESVLPVNAVKSKKRLHGNNILENDGPQLVDGKPVLSNVSTSNVGTHLTSLEKELHTALYDVVESGYAQLQIDGDWLEIELNSALLFPSGSSSPTPSATAILSVIYQVIGDVNNFVRVRGYTDDRPINTELFPSNWELSVGRAAAILRILEQMSMNPARMAIEGYGQYYPNADNMTAQGRAQNRRVVIAISKYGIENSNLLSAPTINVKDIEAINQSNKQQSSEQNKEKKIRVIRLENGGIRITTREDDEEQSPPDAQQ